MDKEQLNKILKGSAFVGGGALSALAANRLVGNNSVKSDIISSLIGAGLGLGTSYLANSSKDLSNNPFPGTSAITEDLAKDKSSDVSFLTTPITAFGQVWQGASRGATAREKLFNKLKGLAPTLNKATDKERANFDALAQSLAEDEARAERQVDAAWTLGGTLTGAGAGFGIGESLKATVAKKTNAKIDKVRDLVNTVMDATTAKKNPISLNAQYNTINASSTASSKLKNAANVLHQALGGGTPVNGTARASGKAADAFLDLANMVKGKNLKTVTKLLTRPHLSSSLGWKGRLAAAGLGALATGLGVSVLTNYKGSRDNYIDTVNQR